MTGFLIALLSGALMSIQGAFNTQVTKESSIWVTASFVQFTALLVCLAAWAVCERNSFLVLTRVQPRYLLLGGAIGAFITFTVIKSFAMLGPAKSAMIIVISQIVVAYGIELLGIWGTQKQPFSIRKLIGMAVAIAGIMIFKWK